MLKASLTLMPYSNTGGMWHLSPQSKKIRVSISANQFVKIQTHTHHLLVHIHLDGTLFGATIAYGMN